MNKFEVNVREDTRPTAKRAGHPYGYSTEFAVTYTPIQSGVFHIYLFGEIEASEQFISAIEALQAASENDTVVLHLSTIGGSLDATDTFIMAMEDCVAKIIVRASGGVHSAGTVILMHADEFYLSENFNALIHNGSVGVGGKTSDFKAQAKYTMGYMDKVMRRAYDGFLTPKEIEDLIDGKDIWLDAEGFGKRFEIRQALLAERANEAQTAVLEKFRVALEESEPQAVPKRPRKPKTE